MPRPDHSKKRFTNRKETKTADIKRALTHRARLRKNYFKLLKSEGLEEHEKLNLEADKPSNDEDESGDSHDDSASDEEVGDKEHTEKLISKNKKHSISSKQKPLNFAERAAIAKQRKEEQRKAKLAQVQEKLQHIEKQQKIRELKKQQLKQKTKYGQPVMGPRINNLLDKIKRDHV